MATFPTVHFSKSHLNVYIDHSSLVLIPAARDCSSRLLRLVLTCAQQLTTVKENVLFTEYNQ